MRKIYLLIIVIGVGAGFALWVYMLQTSPRQSSAPITDFESCVAAGNQILEAHPRECRDGKRLFVENIGNELEKIDRIRINTPRPNEVVRSPLTITGEARGNWFFEASFPVVITDWDGKIIGQGVAQATSDWMTMDFVPFKAILTFTQDPQVYSDRGTLILRRDNPSGLPENDEALEIPVRIE